MTVLDGSGQVLGGRARCWMTSLAPVVDGTLQMPCHVMQCPQKGHFSCRAAVPARADAGPCPCSAW